MNRKKYAVPELLSGSSDPMVAVPVTLPEAGTAVETPLKFRHVGAVLEFDITGVPAGETLGFVQLVSGEGVSPATDGGVYDFKNAGIFRHLCQGGLELWLRQDSRGHGEERRGHLPLRPGIVECVRHKLVEQMN